MQEPNEGLGITWVLLLESSGQGEAVGSGKGKMVRNNTVKSVENAKWSQNMSAYWGKPEGRNPRVLILATVNDT